MIEGFEVIGHRAWQQAYGLTSWPRNAGSKFKGSNDMTICTPFFTANRTTYSSQGKKFAGLLARKDDVKIYL